MSGLEQILPQHSKTSVMGPLSKFSQARAVVDIVHCMYAAPVSLIVHEILDDIYVAIEEIPAAPMPHVLIALAYVVKAHAPAHSSALRYLLEYTVTLKVDRCVGYQGHYAVLGYHVQQPFVFWQQQGFAAYQGHFSNVGSVMLKEITDLIIVGPQPILYWCSLFDTLPLAAAIGSAVVAAEIAGGVPAYVYDGRIKSSDVSRGHIKVLIHIIVPVSFAAPILFGLDTIGTVLLMQSSRLYGPAYVSQPFAQNYVLDIVIIEAAQHVGITSTTGLDVAAEIDV